MSRAIPVALVRTHVGKLFVRVENVPSPTNPKTSYMAALSAIALPRRITASLVVRT